MGHPLIQLVGSLLLALYVVIFARSAERLPLILQHGWRVIGIRDGFDGLICPDRTFELTLNSVSGILPRGGTTLGTTNCGNLFAYKFVEGGVEKTRDVSDAAN
mgnify:CR=1 FL=1